MTNSQAEKLTKLYKSKNHQDREIARTILNNLKHEIIQCRSACHSGSKYKNMEQGTVQLIDNKYIIQFFNRYASDKEFHYFKRSKTVYKIKKNE